MDEDEKYQVSMTASARRNQSIAKSTARMVRGRRVDDGRGGYSKYSKVPWSFIGPSGHDTPLNAQTASTRNMSAKKVSRKVIRD